MATGMKNQPFTAKPGRVTVVTHGPMTEATATLDGQQVGSFICPPGRRYRVLRNLLFVGTRATTGTTYVTVEKVASGGSVGSGDNVNGLADNAGPAVDDNGSLAADNSWVNLGVDDDESTSGANIVNPGDRFFVDTSGTLTGLANCYVVLELEEIAPLAGV